MDEKKPSWALSFELPEKAPRKTLYFVLHDMSVLKIKLDGKSLEASLIAPSAAGEFQDNPPHLILGNRIAAEE